jgi:hypothetical protein
MVAHGTFPADRSPVVRVRSACCIIRRYPSWPRALVTRAICRQEVNVSVTSVRSRDSIALVNASRHCRSSPPHPPGPRRHAPAPGRRRRTGHPADPGRQAQRQQHSPHESNADHRRHDDHGTTAAPRVSPLPMRPHPQAKGRVVAGRGANPSDDLANEFQAQHARPRRSIRATSCPATIRSPSAAGVGTGMSRPRPRCGRAPL